MKFSRNSNDQLVVLAFKVVMLSGLFVDKMVQLLVLINLDKLDLGASET